MQKTIIIAVVVGILCFAGGFLVGNYRVKVVVEPVKIDVAGAMREFQDALADTSAENINSEKLDRPHGSWYVGDKMDDRFISQIKQFIKSKKAKTNSYQPPECIIDMITKHKNQGFYSVNHEESECLTIFFDSMRDVVDSVEAILSTN